MQLPQLFGKRILTASRKHAAAEYPKEAVGAVVAGKYVRLTNVHPDPENNFCVSVDEINQRGGYDNVAALIHSHNTAVHPFSPSEADMVAQIGMGIPFGIQAVNEHGAGNILWWGQGVPQLPYEGRPYIFGVYDCYSIIRDYYATEHNIHLSDYARSDYFWEEANPPDMYLRNMQAEGFVQVTDLQPSDLILVRIRSKVVNHAIIYLGGDQGLHHPTATLSRTDSINRYIDPERGFLHSIWRHSGVQPS